MSRALLDKEVMSAFWRRSSRRKWEASREAAAGLRLLAGANALHAAKSLVEESRIFGPGLYNENKKVLLTQVDTVSEEKGRTMKTQLGEETNVANLMSSLEAAGRLRQRDHAGRRSGDTRRRMHRCRETKADAARQRQMNQACAREDDKPSGKRALLLSHSIQLVFSGFQC